MARLPPPLEQHFRAPWRTPSFPQAGAGGQGENAACGDRVQLELHGPPSALQVRLAMRGCSATVAVASLVAQRVHSSKLADARALEVRALVEEAGGLSPVQQHAIAVVERAFGSALASYLAACDPGAV